MTDRLRTHWQRVTSAGCSTEDTGFLAPITLPAAPWETAGKAESRRWMKMRTRAAQEDDEEK